MKRAAPSLPVLVLSLLGAAAPPARAQVHFWDLSRAANMGPAESFDEVTPGVRDLRQKEGMGDVPQGPQTFRGVPFLILDPSQNNGHSFIALKGRRKGGFPQAVDLPAGHLKAATLYFLHTCRWGGTAPNVTVAEYDVIYDDGRVEVVPLRVGLEMANFWGSDDTPASYLGWWHKYKNAGMGLNIFPWKNPHPEVPIQSILFKSLDKMPVPVLFAVTASNGEFALSATSPKPEKTFQTDTRRWAAFPPSEAGTHDPSIRGTALDMGFLTDAPAGKHGRVKAEGDGLVFEDGTPARFWGARLPRDWESWSPEELQRTLDRMAAYGCNLVEVEGEAPAPLAALVASCKAKGLYVLSKDGTGGPAAGPSLTPALGAQEGVASDPAVVPAGLVNLGGTPEQAPSPTESRLFQDIPLVTTPEDNPLTRLVVQRTWGRPFVAQWAPDWPNEYLCELPLLWSSYAGLEGWGGVVGGEMQGGEWNPVLAPGSGLNDKPSLLLQWPAAALAYRRGDLKEGRILVLDPAGKGTADRLKALAHRSGIQAEGGELATDPAGQLKAKIQPKLKSLISDTAQIHWRGNVGVVQVSSPRFQAVAGFLGHRKLTSPVWQVETANPFASISLVSLNKNSLWASDHLLATGVTRMENTGQVYNAAKTKLLNRGAGPVLFEPLEAKITLFRYHKDPKLRVRGLDANGQPLQSKVPVKWIKNSLVINWIPAAFYLEIFKSN